MPHVPPLDDHTPRRRDTTAPTWTSIAADALIDPTDPTRPPRPRAAKRPLVVPPRGVWGPLPADPSPLIDNDEN